MTAVDAGRQGDEAHSASSHFHSDSQVDVSVVMPCLNEEQAVASCVETALSTLARSRWSGEVVVVDNASSDRSALLAEAAGARVVHESARGYGNAYLRGLAEARGRFIVLADADGTYDFASLERFVEPLTNGTDLVVGSRLRGTIDNGAMPWLHRYIGNPFLSRVMRVLFTSDLSDVYCGMRSVKREALSGLHLSAPGMEFALEMLIEAKRRGARVKEVPIRYQRRMGGSPKLRTWRDGWRSLRFMVVEARRSRNGTLVHPTRRPAASESNS